MKNATHRVVILKNINSENITQAIIFLKDSCAAPESKILAEAEKIVEKYMKSVQITQPIPCAQKKNSASNIIKIIFAGVFSLALIGITVILL